SAESFSGLTHPSCSTMSTTPEAPTGGADAPVSKPNQMFKNCWGCRVISGGGLILSGAYVFMAARRVMRQGGPTSMGTVAQITFAASLAAWGLVVLADPVGKAQRKDNVRTVLK
uniref:Distal membrane-arm assembly complex protein 1-like domain-containing protein n=2 Tax=Lates calcarifer TaxID=8187 RepID=A0A4W6EVM3_LATCA